MKIHFLKDVIKRGRFNIRLSEWTESQTYIPRLIRVPIAAEGLDAIFFQQYSGKYLSPEFHPNERRATLGVYDQRYQTFYYEREYDFEQAAKYIDFSDIVVEPYQSIYSDFENRVNAILKEYSVAIQNSVYLEDYSCDDYTENLAKEKAMDWIVNHNNVDLYWPELTCSNIQFGSTNSSPIRFSYDEMIDYLLMDESRKHRYVTAVANIIRDENGQSLIDKLKFQYLVERKKQEILDDEEIIARLYLSSVVSDKTRKSLTFELDYENVQTTVKTKTFYARLYADDSRLTDGYLDGPSKTAMKDFVQQLGLPHFATDIEIKYISKIKYGRNVLFDRKTFTTDQMIEDLLAS